MLVAAAGVADTLIDPTRPTGWNAATAPSRESPSADTSLVLQGVYNMAGSRSAVINGRRVGLGDAVADAEVIEIGDDRVRLRRNGETYELVNERPRIKKRRAADVGLGNDRTVDVSGFLE